MKSLKNLISFLLFIMMTSTMIVSCELVDDDLVVIDDKNDDSNDGNDGNDGNDDVVSSILSEDFEGESFPPKNWAIFAGKNGLGTDYQWQRLKLGNNHVAFCEFETLDDSRKRSQDWLVTPKVTITDDNKILAFNDAGQLALTNPLGSEYTIRVSKTSQTEHDSFVTVDTKKEGEIPHLNKLLTQKRKVDLSAYIGQEVYIAFVLQQNDSDNWFIDNVELVKN